LAQECSNPPNKLYMNFFSTPCLLLGIRSSALNIKYLNKITRVTYAINNSDATTVDNRVL